MFIVRARGGAVTSAANALLKTLEEPGDRTHFMLLSSQPDALLPTIRSRTQRVRFAALPDAVVTNCSSARGRRVPGARRSRGCRGEHAGRRSAHADDEESAARERFVQRALAAIEAPTLGPALELAEEAKKDKGELPTRLAALATAFAGEAPCANAAERGARGRRGGRALSAGARGDTAARGERVGAARVESLMVRMRARPRGFFGAPVASPPPALPDLEVPSRAGAPRQPARHPVGDEDDSTSPARRGTRR